MNRCDVCGGTLTPLGYCPNGYPRHTDAEIRATLDRIARYEKEES